MPLFLDIKISKKKTYNCTEFQHFVKYLGASQLTSKR